MTIILPPTGTGCGRRPCLGFYRLSTSAEFPPRRRDLGHHFLRDVVQRGDGQHHDEHGIDDRSRHRHLPRLAEEKERGCFCFQAALE